MLATVFAPPSSVLFIMRLQRPTRLDGGIFLISFAVLLVELLLTRIFSVTMFYHLSFVVVSLAMLGFGASGVVINLWPTLFRESRLAKHLAIGAVLFALTSVVVVGVAFHLPVPLAMSRGNLLRLGLIYILCVIPFLMGGLVVALILTHRTEQANRLYFADLAGAACACLIFIPVTDRLGAPSGVFAAAAVAAAAAVIFAGRDAPKWGRVAVAVGGLMALAAIANMQWGFYDVRVTKGRRQPPTLALKWNSFSRVEVVGTPESMTRERFPMGAGFSQRLDPNLRTTELMLRYDADAATEITRFDGDLNRLAYLRYDVASAPYQMRPHANILILGTGGGRDILTALQAGNKKITGVEINPLTVKLMRRDLREFTGGIYDGYPGVEIVNDEGRNFLRRKDATVKYDLIQASLVDTWAATAAGAYALAENNLYTVEAFEDYLRHLSPGGVLAFSRWYTNPPVEVLRVVSLAREALKRQDNTADPSAHVFVVCTDSIDGRRTLSTTLVKRTPFTTDELDRLRAWAAEMNFPVVYAPDDAARGVEPNEFHRLVSAQSAEFAADFPYELSAVYDDRPFFFDRVPLVSWAAHRLGVATSRVGAAPMTLGGQTLLAALIVSALFTALLLLLPVLSSLRQRRGAALSSSSSSSASSASEPSSLSSAGETRGGRALLWVVYFASLGLGFIAIEIVLIQRFNLFFGYPVYSLTVVLFTMLLASGAGSYLAGRWGDARLLPRSLMLICAMGVLYTLALPALLRSLPGVSTPVRIVLGVVLVAPLGLLMGVPFPTGLRRAGREAKNLVAWGWAANGAASVFGSTLTMLVSMTYGFTVSFFLGTLAYVAALVVVLTLQRGQRSEVRG